MTKNLEKYLKCLDCGGGVKAVNKSYRCLRCGRSYSCSRGIPVFMENESLAEESRLTAEKYEYLYQQNLVYDNFSDYCEQIDLIKKFFSDNKKSKKKSLLLDAGCGNALTSISFAKDSGCQLIGYDISLPALRKAFNTAKKNKVNSMFIAADMRDLPFKDDSFDYVFGGGVFFYAKKITPVLKETSRVLKKRGKMLAIMPVLSLSTLTYGQLFGYVPDFPVVSGIFDFIHLRLFKGRFCRHGYQRILTLGQWAHLLRKAGFNKIKFGHITSHLKIQFVKLPLLNSFLKTAESYRPFWGFVYVICEKK